MSNRPPKGKLEGNWHIEYEPNMYTPGRRKKYVNFMIWIKSVVVMWLLLTFRSYATQVIVVIMNTGSLFLKKHIRFLNKC